MSLYAGINLHSNNSVLAVIDKQDRVLQQCRLPNDLTPNLPPSCPSATQNLGKIYQRTIQTDVCRYETVCFLAQGRSVRLISPSFLDQENEIGPPSTEPPW